MRKLFVHRGEYATHARLLQHLHDTAGSKLNRKLFPASSDFWPPPDEALVRRCIGRATETPLLGGPTQDLPRRQVSQWQLPTYCPSGSTTAAPQRRFSNSSFSPLRAAPASIAGRWRIVEMEVWGEDVLDLVEPAYIEFGSRHGSFRFVAFEGGLDCRYGEHDGRPTVDFSWRGADDGRDACGRGWARIAADGRLEGRLLYSRWRRGDDSSLIATRFGDSRRPGCQRFQRR